MRDRLRIGEAARLVGVTPKAVRHYEKIGLLPDAERSGSGYRLCSANDLLRLHRIKKLRSLGLSLQQVRFVLGEGDGEFSLRDTLTALRAEVDAQISSLEERRRRIDETISGEGSEASPSFERAMELLGEHLCGVSETALEQEKRLWAVLDAFEWPEDYEEENEQMSRYYADHPEEYRTLVAMGERLATLADVSDEDPEVGRVADELWSYLEKNPPPGHLKQPAWASPEPIGQALVGLTMSVFSPAQRRVMALLEERAGRENSGR